MKKKITNLTPGITTIDWLNHFSRTAANLTNREAVTASNKALATERVSMVKEYAGNHALLVEHLSLSMAVFTGSKAAKQSLKRSLSAAMVKATNETYTLHFAGDNCTVVGYTAKLPTDKVQEAWDTLGESVPAHVIDAMQEMHRTAAVALREATKELREKAEAIAKEEKTATAKAMLTEAGVKVTPEAIATLVAVIK